MAETLIESGRPIRVNFHAIFAGVIVTLALQIVIFGMLGNALGLSVMNPLLQAFRPLSTGTVLWSLLIPFATFFIGGMTAAAISRGDPGAHGVLHGLIVWCLCILFSGALFALAITGVTHGATDTTYWLVFFTAMCALVGAVAGGYWGALPLHRTIYRERTTLP